MAEGRWGDSKERKGEKEGKDRERKVSLGQKVLHMFGFPGWREQATVLWQLSIPMPPWAGHPAGFAVGSWSRDMEELPPFSQRIWSLPLHQHKKMMEGKK